MTPQSRVEKLKLSGSTDGRMIKVAATSTPGTAVHTATSSTTDTFDEIWIWAMNSDTSARKLTLEFGGTSAPDDTIEVTIPAERGLMLVIPGLVLQNSAAIKAFAASANVVLVGGYVNRLTP